MAAQYWLATVARKKFFRPITVECPCCNEAFVLPAESRHLDDEETKRWLGANSRNCPSCSAPIVKAGGCNHVKCAQCRADFCWACMRLRTSCKAFRCVNGAPYRNAVPGLDGQDNGRSAPQPNDSILTIIDYILERGSPNLTYRQAGVVLLICLFGRHINVVQFIVGMFMRLLSSVIFSQIIMAVSIASMLHTIYRDMRMGMQRQQNRQGRADNVVDLGPAPNGLNRRQIQILEQQMVAEALRRSVQDT